MTFFVDATQGSREGRFTDPASPPPPPRARRLDVRSWRDGALAGISYDLDGQFTGRVAIDWSGLGEAATGLDLNGVETAMAVLVAQFALPAVIAGFARPSETVREALAMLYDIRAYCDETEPVEIVSLTGSEGSSHGRQPTAADPRRTVVLLSGGFDSSLSAALLKQAGQDVVGLFVAANAHVTEYERDAARAVAAHLSIPLVELTLDFPEQEAVGRYYSRSFARYPFYNAVPHGRDLLLAAVAGVVAQALGCGGIAFGHDAESRAKVIPWRGRLIHRHDFESQHGFDLLRRFAQEHAGADLAAFSPLAGLSVYMIRRLLMTRYPEVAGSVHWCLWSKRCGQCLKCVSTYAMQRHLEPVVGAPLFDFYDNPFADEDDEDMALFAAPDRPPGHISYGMQMHHAMADIVERGGVRPDDYWLKVFQDRGLIEVGPEERERIRRVCEIPFDPEEAPSAVAATIRELLCHE